jgi:hypothetical protein
MLYIHIKNMDRYQKASSALSTNNTPDDDPIKAEKFGVFKALRC